ncbi:hypothetical protein RJ639_038106 [Escallonia herrerae]|uniref:Uncharacterized protein n=1 Tax=Escallonia herrerae TaxID=1293975 RepID=A0AA88WMK9_9ASTE|nr:hypothetical protein RJ639_038106 [Escallonia herrerae]
MANENEPAKLLLPYLQRADELQKHEPLVAYYCRLYAMERGLKIPQSERTNTTNALLISLMKQLEKDKKSLKLGPDDNLHLEGFALNVFAKADKQDRAGRADLYDMSTAKTFYAASIFFEILNQFGVLQADADVHVWPLQQLEQKQKYAVWKAADIRKALKEGRKPVPGPPGGDNDLFSTPSSEYDFEPSRTEPAVKPAAESDPSPDSYDKIEPQHYSKVLPSPPSSISPSPSSHVPPSPSPYVPTSSPSNIPSSPSYPSDGHPSYNYHQPPSTNRGENSTYSQPYHHQPYQQDPEQHLPHSYPSSEVSHSYPSNEAAPYSYPNFQSYPSFTESSLPAAPSHYSSYYQSSEAPYSPMPPSNMMNHPSTAQSSSSGRNGTISEAVPTSTQAFRYDSNYQPPPEKIAEAHKAARFAVGALAFDDVSIAVDYLKKSLELLTNPSAGQ